MSGFGPMTIYDAPGNLIKQAVDGELTAKTARSTLFDPDRLMPHERDDLSSLFVDQDSNPLAKTLAGIGTNPWVWMMFLTSPVGGKALGRAGKGLFHVAKEAASQQRKSLGWFSWFQSPHQVMRGTAAPVASQWANNNMIRLAEDDGRMILGATEDLERVLAKRAGVAKLDDVAIGPDLLSSASYKPGSRAHREVSQWEALTAIWNHKLYKPDQTAVRTVERRWFLQDGEGEWRRLEDMVDNLEVKPELLAGIRDEQGVQDALAEAAKRQASKRLDELGDQWDGMSRAEQTRYGDMVNDPNGARENFVNRYSIKLMPEKTVGVETGTLRPALANEVDVRRALDSYGDAAWNWIRQATFTKKSAYVRAVGDSEHFALTGEFKVDRSKARRLAYSLRRDANAADGLTGGPTTLQGREAMLALFDDDVVAGLKNLDPDLREDLLLDKLETLLEPTDWDSAFGSRNQFDLVQVDIGGQRKVPPVFQSAEKNWHAAPWETSSNAKGRVAPLSAKELLVSPDSLEALEDALPGTLTNEGRNHLLSARSKAQHAFNEGRQGVLGMQLRAADEHTQYMNNMRQLTVFDTMRIPDEIRVADGDAIGNLSDSVKYSGAGTYGVGGKKRHIAEPILAGDDVNLGEVFDRVYLGEQSQARRDYVRDMVIPGALNNAGPEWMATYNAHMNAKETANWFAKSWIGESFRKIGGPLGRMVDELEAFGDFNRKPVPTNVTGGMAKWLYVTHLGINGSSIILNLTQPLLMAGLIGGADDIIGAYVTAAKEMASYASERASLGLKSLRPDEKLALIKKHFKYSDLDGENLIGIGPDFHDTIDWQLRQSKGRANQIGEVMMKGFEKSEWFNRNVTAHLYAKVTAKQGGKLRARELQRFVQETQFAASPLNTPRIFQQGPLANPLARMFMTFPLRSFVGVVDVFPRLGGQSYGKGLANVAFRGMGMSALVYETSKGLMGADLSRGLFASAATDLFGGERLLQDGNNWVPVPPIVDIPVDFVRGVAGGDMRLLSDSIARTVPGGVALNKLLGVTGEVPDRGLTGVVGALQKTYADWEHPTEDGMVAVYASDGRLIEYRSSSELWARAAGVDLGAYNQQGGLDGYLVKQREVILEYRRRYLNALRVNDTSKAMRIAAEYEKRVGVPLTVTQEQVKAFVTSQTVGRTERVLDRLPKEVRGTYQQVVSQSGYARNVERQAFESIGTAASRNEYRSNIERQQQLLAELERRVKAVGPAAESGGTFGGFGGF